MCSKVEERAPEQEERDEKLSRHINYKKRTSFSLFISPFSLFQPCAPPVLLFSSAESATRASRTMEKRHGARCHATPVLLIIFNALEFITTPALVKVEIMT